MTTMRKQYSAAFKAQLVKELLKEDKTLTQLASEHKVHPNQLRDWKKTALDGLPALFETDKKAAAATAAYEQKVNELYAEIRTPHDTRRVAQKKSGLDPAAS